MRFCDNIRRGVWRGLGCALIVLLIAGCAGGEQRGERKADTSKLVWPAPPDPARVRYVQAIGKPADVGIRPSGPARLVRWVFGGSEDELLVKPFGICLDEQDNLCLTDTGANAVIFYNRQKRTWKRWTKIGAMRFVSPVSVAKRGDTFYVADSGLGTIVVFNESGKLVRTISDRLERPTAVLITGDRLLVADSQKHAVITFDLNGKLLGQFGQRGIAPGSFNYPTHLAAGRDGTLLVTDSMNSRVQVLDAAGKFKAQVGSVGDSPGHFSRPKGVATDSFGHVYVMDALHDALQIFQPDGKFLLTLGSSGELPGEFWLANGVAISRQNEIFVTDAYNRRVQVFRYVGAQ